MTLAMKKEREKDKSNSGSESESGMGDFVDLMRRKRGDEVP